MAVLAQTSILPLAVAGSNGEAPAVIERHALTGRGMGWAAVHLLSSTLLTEVAMLWARDKRLASAASEVNRLHHPRLH